MQALMQSGDLVVWDGRIAHAVPICKGQATPLSADTALAAKLANSEQAQCSYIAALFAT